MRLATLFVAASAFAASAAIGAGETIINIEDVPANVLETAIQTAPGSEFYRVSTETENGVLVYEFEATSFDGKHIEVDVLADGTLDEVEMEMSLDELPTEVTQGLFAQYPGFTPSYIEASIRSDWSTVYEIEGVSASGERLAVDINESGDIISVSDGALS